MNKIHALMRKRKREKKPKEDWWIRLYVPAEKLLDFIDGFRSAQSREKEQQQFREIYIGADCHEQGRRERIKQIATAMLFMLLIMMIALAAEWKAFASRAVIRENCIYRQAEVPQLELIWEAGEDTGSVSFTLTPQRLPAEGREELFREAENYVRDCVLGGNESLRAIRGDVVFPESVPGTGVTVYCQPGSYRWLNADGSRTIHEIPNEGAEETVQVKLCYYEEEREFVMELLLLPEGSERDRFQKKLETELLCRVADNTAEKLCLPEQIDGIAVEWSVKRTHNGVIILFLGLVAAVCIPVSGRRKQDTMMRKREQELMADYPELVSKYRLLLNAGLSQRAAWERIISDYKRSGRKRYVYEEMLQTMREMEAGVLEIKAYERFGKRCRLLPYLRFSGVLAQNLQKGAKGCLNLLEQEALAAFAERKNAAKKRGEEAGTKLLLPMFGLLGIVLVIVMVPALWNL